jgi:hypothetical protein
VWKKRLASADAKCDFFIRLRETLNKYDGILIGLASSMRCELRALSIMDRAGGVLQAAALLFQRKIPLRPIE